MKQTDILLVTFSVGCITLLAVGVFLSIKGINNSREAELVKTITIQPDIKDTTSYHWVDEFTDAQLREMVRSGHLKLR
jgi:hypothetical protein